MIVTTFLPDSWILLSVTIVSSSLWNIYSYCWWKDEYTGMYCFYNQKKIKVTFGTNETQRSNTRTFYLARINKNCSTINCKSPVTLIKVSLYYHKCKIKIMGENIYKWCDQQGIQFPNVRTTHATYYKKKTI